MVLLKFSLRPRKSVIGSAELETDRTTGRVGSICDASAGELKLQYPTEGQPLVQVGSTPTSRSQSTCSTCPLAAIYTLMQVFVAAIPDVNMNIWTGGEQ